MPTSISEDDLAFARETLGPDATDSEVHDLAQERAIRDARETLPSPVRSESRTAFGLLYFATEAEAEIYGEHVLQRGDTYNGGFYHGMACGRDRSFDHDAVIEGQTVRLYAVSTS